MCATKTEEGKGIISLHCGAAKKRELSQEDNLPEEILKKNNVPKSLLRTGVFFRFAAAPETGEFSVGRQQT